MPPKAKRSRADIEAEIEALQAEALAADESGDDYEIWTEHEMGGKQVRGRLTGQHAQKFLDSLFGENSEGDPAAATEATEEEETDPDPAPTRRSVWGR